MEINLSTGTLKIGEIIVTRSANWRDVQLVLHKYSWRSGVVNDSYQSYTVNYIMDKDYVFHMGLYFKSNSLSSVLIILDTEDTSLEEFIENSLEKVKQKTIDLIR